jgi:hypothetical protein
MSGGKKKGGSLDVFLILATAGVLFVIAAIAVYGMFSFKFAALHELAPGAKMAYMNRMNAVVAPFIIVLILLLGICIPKRLLPAGGLGWFALGLVLTAITVSVWQGIRAGLLTVLAASLLLQLIVLGMAAVGSRHLHFAKSGYWVRLGSSLIHLGLVLFILDMLLHRHLTLHIFLFWVTTAASVLGMLLCFYSQGVASLIRRIRTGRQQQGANFS